MEFIFTTIAILILVFSIMRLTLGKERSDRTVRTISENLKTPAEQSSAYINSNLKKAQKAIERSISKSYLVGCSWIKTNDETANVLYTFRSNDELLITVNGIVERAIYELIVDNNSILITRKNITEHYNMVNVENDFLFLNKVFSDSVIVLANQTKFKDLVKAQINDQARQFQKFEIERNKEREKYSAQYDYDHLFESFYFGWQRDNPNKSIYDYIAELEEKTRFDPTEFNLWKKYNEEKSVMDFARYLVDRKYKS